MISTLANPNVIKMSVPRAKSDTKTKQSVVVSVDKNKNVFVGSKRIVMDSLESVLQKYINKGDSIKPAVVINADSVAQWGDSKGDENSQAPGSFYLGHSFRY
jgi:biopolymer transport protein ExbD